MESKELKIGLAMLEDVEKDLESTYGSTIARGPLFDGVADMGSTKRLIKDLKTAKNKIGDFKQGQAKAAFLMGRICAVGYEMISQNRIHKKCIKHYEEAIQLGFDEAIAKYHMAKHEEAWNNTSRAVKLFEEVVELLGVDDSIGMDAAKQIEKLKAKKGGCFIATAVYGSYSAPEVLILRKFRDNILLPSQIGSFFVKFYYRYSPPIAKFLEKHKLLQKLVRDLMIQPIVTLCRKK